MIGKVGCRRYDGFVTELCSADAREIDVVALVDDRNWPDFGVTG